MGTSTCVVSIVFAGLALALGGCAEDADGMKAPDAVSGQDASLDGPSSGGLPYEGPYVEESGGLPDTPPPAEVRDFQERLATRLATGLDASHFSDLAPPPADKANARQGPLYLVMRHLELVGDADRPDSFCDNGTAYSGFVGTKPYTLQIVESEARIMTGYEYFGMMACEGDGGDIEVRLLPSDHPGLGDTR